MAMYYCEECDRYVDDDYNPMVEHPYRKRFASYRDKACCNECSVELEYEMNDAIREDYNDER